MERVRANKDGRNGENDPEVHALTGKADCIGWTVRRTDPKNICVTLVSRELLCHRRATVHRVQGKVGNSASRPWHVLL